MIYLPVYLTPNKCGLSALHYREIVNVTFNTKQIFSSLYRDQLLLQLLGDFFFSLTYFGITACTNF